MKLLQALFLFLAWSNLRVAHAKIVYYGSQTENITIVHNQTTIFRFHEDVKTIAQASNFIIAPADAADPNYQVLSIRSKALNSMDELTFMLADNSVIHLKITSVPQQLPDKTDNFYYFKPKELEVDRQANSEKGTDVTELELMKAMIRKEQIVGYNFRSLIRKIDLEQKDLKVELIQVFTGPKFNGYVFKLLNDSRKDVYELDMEKLSFGSPNVALLSQSDQKIIGPKQSTLLRIVTRPTSVYYEVKLPVALTTTTTNPGDINEATND